MLFATIVNLKKILQRKISYNKKNEDEIVVQFFDDENEFVVEEKKNG